MIRTHKIATITAITMISMIAAITLVALMALLAISISVPGMASEPANASLPVLDLVATLSDFGSSDYYAGALEGSIYSANPSVRISTISNEVKPFDIAEGSYILAKAAKRYPPGTVFVGEVDPGSEKNRRFIVLETSDGKLFVGPDNGLFTEVMDELGLAHVYQITNRSLMSQENESATFRGFYVYGPVAAHLAGGVPPDEVGPEIRDPVRLPVVRPGINGPRITGSIVHVDRYGNMITNIPERLANEAGMATGSKLTIAVGNQSFDATFATTYGDVANGQWLALISSDGQLEVARNMADAAKTASAAAGDRIMLSIR
jgi:S-adenosylmethionine hydrolase